MKDNMQKKCNNFMLIFIMLTCREKQELVRAALLTDQRRAGEISSRRAVSLVALANTSSLRCRVGHAARSIEPGAQLHICLGVCKISVGAPPVF